ncbi:LOW QUALITY PROTEIN: hypothetical protein HID58_069366 [Brassica napus]|uniref:Uncharacterized protein n=1 Tax=Brassica napus TaxID=3708 RepID=A0ABQ7YVN7_BRANA|nr:LOW QUALITY PROTEIN: hypothetical protein HID58_069366 [Brassica napus]
MRVSDITAIRKIRESKYVGQAGIRSSSPGEPTRVTAKLAGEHNHATVQFAGELTGTMAELAGRVQPHGGSARRRADRRDAHRRAARVTVQLSGEWLLCGIRSFVHFRSFFQRNSTNTLNSWSKAPRSSASCSQRIQSSGIKTKPAAWHATRSVVSTPRFDPWET